MPRPLRIRVHRKFDTDGEKWRPCYICGNFTATQYSVGTIYGGRLYPESELIEHEGHYYCRDHYNWRFAQERKDDITLSIEDEDYTE